MFIEKGICNAKDNKKITISTLALFMSVFFHASTYGSVAQQSNRDGSGSVGTDSSPVKEDKLDFSFIQGGSAVDPHAWSEMSGKFIAGKYFLDFSLNNGNPVKRELIVSPEDKDAICFSSEWLRKSGILIATDYFSSYFNKERNCYTLSAAPSVTVDFDMAAQSLKINLPQAAISDIPADVPWEFGNSALRVNYTANTSVTEVDKTSFGSADIRANIGSWVLSSTSTMTDKDADIVLLNASRALQSLKADFTVGKTFVGDDLLGSVGVLGTTLKSNNSMRQGDLGYTPVFQGVAKGPARVTLMQSGSSIYSELVPPGPFIIRNVSLLNSGDVEMSITEQDGSVARQIFPLTVMAGMINPGSAEYSISAGQREKDGDRYAATGGMMSLGLGYGLNNLTMRAGSVLHKDYQGVSAGMTTSLGVLGGLTISGAMSQVHYDDGAKERGQKVQSTWNKTLAATGTSLFVSASRRLSKSFTDFSSFSPSRRQMCDAFQVSYPGTNLSQPDGIRKNECPEGATSVPKGRVSKNEINAGFSQPFGRLFSASVSGWQRDYWDSSNKETGLTLNLNTQISGATVSLGGSMSQSQTQDSRRNNWSTSASVSVPFSVFDRKLSSFTSVTTGKQGGASINSGISGAVNERLYYTLGGGRDSRGDVRTNLSASYTGNRAGLGVNLSQSAQGVTGSASVTGSVLAVPAAHSLILSRTVGDTVAVARVKDTPGVRFSSGADVTDGQGNVVIPLNGYRYNTVTVDSSTLPKNMELGETSRSVVPANQAVVYMPFETIKVKRYLLQVRRAGGGFVPSGTWAKGARSVPLGFVVQNGVLLINAVEHPGDVRLNNCVIPSARIKESEMLQEVVCDE